LVKGVWTKVFVKVSQQGKLQGRDFFSKEKPMWNQAMNLALDIDKKN
jgi:hypothetical protein